MGNLTASGGYPFVQWQPSEGNKVWHTDQEFADSSGNSYMFRIYNAEYDTNSGTWHTLTTGVSNAYATVQNPDGSIHYYWNNGVTTNFSWVGSGNNTIYNAVDFGTTAGGSASANTTALASLFTAMATATAPALVGGSAFIPQYNFPVNASLSTAPLTVPDVG